MEPSTETDDLFDDVDDQPLYLAFRVVDENYLVSVKFVAEVIRVPRIVPVPDVPDYLPGVVNLRGQVIPVVDVPRRFGLESRAEKRRVIIVIEDNGQHVGLLVDEVRRVVAVSDDRLDRRLLGDRSRSVVEAVATTEAGDYLVLEVPQFMKECRPAEAA